MLESKWITCRITNGLGNRLFQVAALLGAAEKSGRKPVFFLPQMSKYEHGNWNLFLECVPDLEIIESSKEWTRISDEVFPTEKELETDLPIVLKGWFQDLKHFPSLDNPLLPKLPKTLQISPKNQIAIFFRFGDYCFLPHHQQPLASYYVEGIHRFPKGTECVLFSDSPNRLLEIQKEFIEMGYPSRISEKKDTMDVIQEAVECRLGCIGTNSTFSWWITWMAWDYYTRPEDYIAYFPDTWLQGKGAMNLFNLPFTRAIKLSEIPSDSPKLKSFQYNQN